MKKEGLITKNIDFCTVRTDKHLLLIIDAETEQQNELLKRIENELEKKDFSKTDFDRKKKTALSSCIYMTDSIYSLNSFVMNSLILDKSIDYNIYKHYKELDYDSFLKFVEKLDFSNNSILYVNKSL